MAVDLEMVRLLVGMSNPRVQKARQYPRQAQKLKSDPDCFLTLRVRLRCLSRTQGAGCGNFTTHKI